MAQVELESGRWSHRPYPLRAHVGDEAIRGVDRDGAQESGAQRRAAKLELPSQVHLDPVRLKVERHHLHHGVVAQVEI